jgi:RND family efflux transporter MFP subunit
VDKAIATFAAGVVLALAADASAQDLQCLIEPQRSVTLSFAVEGAVADVLVDRGDLVKKGQVLAHLQADVERASLEVARARAEANANMNASNSRVEYAGRALVRRAALGDEGVVSEGLLDEARREKELAAASLLDAKEAKRIAKLEVQRSAAILEQRRVSSPVDGVVVKRILAPGEWADPPQVLELAQIDPLRIEVFAPLRLLGQIAVGDTAVVMPEQPVGGRHEAKVTVVDSVVDAASGTFGVRLELPNEEHELPAGLKCRIRFAGVEPPPDVPDAAETRAGRRPRADPQIGPALPPSPGPARDRR